MGKRAICSAFVVAAALALVPAKSFGLAALAKGAKTSCKPTAPAGSPLYYCQVNCDPFGVVNFNLQFSYDPTLLDFVGFTGINGYDVNATEELTPAGAPSGLIDITGGTGSPPFDEEDVIGLQFQLKSALIRLGTAYDTPLPFRVFANSDSTIHARDQDNPDDTMTYVGPADPQNPDAGGIQESSANLTLNEIHAQDTAVPLPASAWTGIVLISGLGGMKLLRRKATVA